MTARAGFAAATWLVLAVGGTAARGQSGPSTPAPTDSGVRAGVQADPGARPGAAVGPAAASSGPDAVEMTVVGHVTDYERLIAPIGARTPGGVPLFWNRIDRFNPLAELLRAEPASTPVALRCWIDLSDLKRATLYFATRGGERFLVRELALSGRLDEVDQQSLAQVLEISIAALLENQDNGLTRAEAREILARAQALTPAGDTVAALGQRAWHWGVAASYGIEAAAATVPIGQGPGLIVSLTSSPAPAVPGTGEDGADSVDLPSIAGRHLGVWLGGHYRAPVSARGAEVGIRIETLAARAGVAGGWGRFSARLGVGPDWTHVTPLAGNGGDSVTLTAPHWSLSWVVGAALAARLPIDRLRVRALQRLTLAMVLTVESLPAPTEFEVRDATGARVAFAFRRARPALEIELGF